MSLNLKAIITADASGFASGAKKAASSLQKLKQQAQGGSAKVAQFNQVNSKAAGVMGRVTQSTQRTTAKLLQFKKANAKAAAGMRKLTQRAQAATTKVQQFNKTSAKATARLNTMGRAAGMASGGFGRLQGIMATIGLGLVVRKFIEVNTVFESLQASLKTVTGSLEAGQEAFKNLQSFASTTPYALRDVTTAFIKLKSMGLDASNKSMKAYGNTASAMNKDVNMMIEAVADAVTGEFERLKEFGIKASTEGDKVSFTFKGTTTTIRKSAKDIEKYLQDIGHTHFASAMDAQMKTLKGAFSNLGDAVDSLFYKMGKGDFNPALASSIRDLSASLSSPETLNGLKNVATAMGALVRVLGFAAGTVINNLGAIAGGLTGLLVVKKVWPAVKNLGKAFKATNVSLVKTQAVLRVLPARLATTRGAALGAAVGVRTLGVAARGASLAMAAMGGPVGLAITGVAVAVGFLATRQTEAEKATIKHSAAMEKLNNNYAEFTTASAKARAEMRKKEKADLAILSKDVERKKRELNEALAKQKKQEESYLKRPTIYGGAVPVHSKDASPDTIKGLRVEYANLNDQLRASKAHINDLDKIEKQENAKENENHSKKIKERVASLQFEAEQLGRTALQQHLYSAARKQDIDTSKLVIDAQGRLTGVVDAQTRALLENEQASFKASTAQATLKDVDRQYGSLQDRKDNGMGSLSQWRTQALASVAHLKEGGEEARRKIEAIYSEKSLAASKHWKDGAIRGLKDVARGAGDMAKQTQGVVTNAFKGMEDALVSFVMSGKANFKDFANSVISDIARIVLRKALIEPIAGAISGIFTTPDLEVGTPNFGGGTSHRWGNPKVREIAGPGILHHTGGMAGKGQVRRYHTGGMASDEVPAILKQGEGVFTPWQMQNANHLIAAMTRLSTKPAGTTVQVHVHNTAKAEVRTEESVDGQGNVRLDVMVDDMMASKTNPNSRFGQALEQNYGLRPATGR